MKTKYAEVIKKLKSLPGVFYVWDGDLGPKVLMQPWGRSIQLTWSQAIAFVEPQMKLDFSPPRKQAGRETAARQQGRRRVG